MSIYSEMQCWEIMQCKRKELCFFPDVEKKTCWDQVKENDSNSFHICTDCLVYMVKNVDSPLSELEIRFILEQRKSTFEGKCGQSQSFSCIGTVPRIEETLRAFSTQPM